MAAVANRAAPGEAAVEGRERSGEVVVRVRPLTIGLALVVLGLLGANYALVRDTGVKNAVQQAEIERMVRGVNDFTARIQGRKDRQRALFDPLVILLELDRKLLARGLQVQSGKDFADRLAEENRKLLASGLAEYIDTCAQKGEVEKHLLYEGLHGPVQALPGWSDNWQTACISILPP